MIDPAAHSAASRDVDRREDAVAVVRQLREAGHVAYFAGGCVRDELLGLVPKDYDVATDATPDVVREVFGRRRTQAVGAAFGVILVHEGRSVIEVATFRADEGYTDGRRPDAVRFTNAEEDARRRDFTINGLFRDPLATAADPEDDGVIDFVDGKRDLSNRLLRCIGKPIARFGEDYLRMLRAVRFAARFGLTIHPDTFAAIKEHAPRLAAISPERIGDEIRRMLTAPTRGDAWRLLWETGLVTVVFRTLPGTPSDNAHRPFTRYVAKLPQPISVGLALATTAAELLHQVGMPVRELFAPRTIGEMSHALRRALRLSNDESANVEGALAAGPLLEDGTPTVPQLKRFLAGPFSGDARTFLDAAAKADRTLKDRVEWLRQRFAELEQQDYAPPPLVTGDDLVRAGLSPGPSFKRAIDAAYDAQLERHDLTKDEALTIAINAASDEADDPILPARRAMRRS